MEEDILFSEALRLKRFPLWSQEAEGDNPLRCPERRNRGRLKHNRKASFIFCPGVTKSCGELLHPGTWIKHWHYWASDSGLEKWLKLLLCGTVVSQTTPTPCQRRYTPREGWDGMLKYLLQSTVRSFCNQRSLKMKTTDGTGWAPARPVRCGARFISTHLGVPARYKVERLASVRDAQGFQVPTMPCHPRQFFNRWKIK